MAGHVAAFGVLAVALWVAEYRLGRFGYGILGLGSALAFWYTLGELLSWEPGILPFVYALVAISWIGGGAAIGRLAGETAEGKESLGRLAGVGGWLVLATATLAMPALTRAVPYFGTPRTVDVLVAAGVTACWLVGATIERDGISAYGAAGASFYLVAIGGWAIRPELDPASHAVLLVSVALVWSQGHVLAERGLGMRLVADLIGRRCSGSQRFSWPWPAWRLRPSPGASGRVPRVFCWR